ncbi:hypothetical protein PF003_g9999 [Phytophthora fragariae]|nr:hypothetical protein PF003_g9999 [Phytophthora fragariae]
MTRITATDAAVESKSRLGSQWGTDNTGNGRTEERHTGESTPTAPRQRARTDANQKHSTAGSVNSVDSDPPIGLVVALFHDGFVCRHVNKENEGVEGFAQPYDAESSYFLACIDNGRVPEGLPDMIAYFFVLLHAWNGNTPVFSMLANAQRLMQAEKTPPQETEHIAGSMRYLARQLGDLTRPSDVIAVAGAHELKLAEDEGRELHEPDWMDNGERSPLPVWGSAESAIALVTPDSDPALHLQRIDNDDDIMLGHFFELTTDTASLIKDYQPTAAAPHFNAFDDDGNLQLQSA